MLLASAAVLVFYNRFPYPGLFSAVPLSVSLATAWTAGHRRWALAIAAWFGFTLLVFLAVSDSPASSPPAGRRRRLGPGAAGGGAAAGRGGAHPPGTRPGAPPAGGRAGAVRGAAAQRPPAPIATRLKSGEEPIADGFPEVTVLFADLVEFTRRSREVSPAQVVEALNELFSAFDELARRHGLEKIKTVGDAYMVAGGLPEPRPDHAQAAAEMALAMREEVAGRVDPAGEPLQVRIGIDSGPVVAGVIGRDKFSYDLWGDTVNTASRMESLATPGCIQVTDRAYRRLRDRYRFERRGPIEVKGKGEMVTWFLVGRNP